MTIVRDRHRTLPKEIRNHILLGEFRISEHAFEEMLDETISLDDLTDCLVSCKIIEDYPEHRRGPCCLVCGGAGLKRFLHVVCTTGRAPLVVITVYWPDPAKWETPFKRGKAK